MVQSENHGVLKESLKFHKFRLAHPALRIATDASSMRGCNPALTCVAMSYSMRRRLSADQEIGICKPNRLSSSLLPLLFDDSTSDY